MVCAFESSLSAHILSRSFVSHGLLKRRVILNMSQRHSAIVIFWFTQLTQIRSNSIFELSGNEPGRFFGGGPSVSER